MNTKLEKAAEITYINNLLKNNHNLTLEDRAAWSKKRTYLMRKVGIKNVKSITTTSSMASKLLKLIKKKND